MSNSKKTQPAMTAPQENLDLDSRGWIEKNVPLVLVAVTLLVLLGGALAFVNAASAARENAAALAGIEAKSAEDFIAVAKEFSGTSRAPIALIQAATLQNASAQWEALRDTANEFLSRYPQHPAAVSMHMALGTALEALGDKTGALAVFEETADKYIDSFRSAEALFRAGVIQQAADENDEARRLFDAVVEKFSSSTWAGQARQRLAQLPAPPTPPMLQPAPDAVEQQPVVVEQPPAVMPQPMRAPEDAPLIPPEP